MPERLKNVDYANADRESIRELLELIQPLDMETEKYLEGVTDTQLHGLLKNDIENYIKIREIVLIDTEFVRMLQQIIRKT